MTARVPPGSLGPPYIGEALKILADPFGYTLRRTREHGPIWKTRILGDIVVFFAGPKAFAFFMDPNNFTRENGTPAFVQKLLHPDAVPFLDGPRHAARKRLLLAAFTDEALASYLPGMFAIFERFVTKWTAAGEVAVNDDLVQLGFDIADHLFAASDPSTSNVESARDFTMMNRGTFAPPINLPFTAFGKALRARDRLRAYIKRQVATRDGAGTALGVLKTARGPSGEALSSEELEIELLHFFYAAHGGLTAALAWLLVVLGSHPDLAARVRAEADAKLDAATAIPTLTQASSLALARAISREVLRVYPNAPVTFLGVAQRDLELDGYTIPRGWKGAGAIWATLQDGTTFRDPSKFDPERLDDATLAALPDSAYIPQGGGPPHGHRCAGERLIQLVMPAFLGWFAQRFDIALPPQDLAPGAGGLGPLPKSGLRVTIQRRAR